MVFLDPCFFSLITSVGDAFLLELAWATEIDGFSSDPVGGINLLPGFGTFDIVPGAINRLPGGRRLLVVPRGLRSYNDIKYIREIFEVFIYI